MQFAIVMTFVFLVSIGLLLHQFVAGSLIGANDEQRPGWPSRTRRAH